MVFFQCLKKSPVTLSRGCRTKSVTPRRCYVLRVEVLKDRTLPSTFMVLNLHDSGPDSLRAAIAVSAFARHSGEDRSGASSAGWRIELLFAVIGFPQ